MNVTCKCKEIPMYSKIDFATPADEMLHLQGEQSALQTATALNALACMRRTSGDARGALSAARQALQVLEECKVQSADADFLRSTAWDVIELVRASL